MSGANNNNADNTNNTNSSSNELAPSASRSAYFEVLGINATTDEDEIKAAYRRLAMKWHPDKNPSPDATSKFQEISYAYRKLTTDDSDSDEDIEFSAEDIFLSVFGPLFRFGRNKNSKVVFNMSDFVCPHHREFASRFFDSSSDSEWDSEDSYYDYEYDTDEDEDSDSDFFYSFHTHPPQKQTKPKEPGVPERPAPPRLLESTDASLKVGWDVPLNNGAPILFYVLEMDTGVVAGANFNEIYRGKKRSYEVKRLTPGTTYHFLVKAANKYGAGGFSRVASFMTQGSASKKKAASKGPAENGVTANSKKKKRRARKKAQENGQANEALSEEPETQSQTEPTNKEEEKTSKSKQTKQATKKASEDKQKAEPKKEQETTATSKSAGIQTEPSQKGKQTEDKAKPAPAKQTTQNTKQSAKPAATKEGKGKASTEKQQETKPAPKQTTKQTQPQNGDQSKAKPKPKPQPTENGKADAKAPQNSGNKKKTNVTQEKGGKEKEKEATKQKEKEREKEKQKEKEREKQKERELEKQKEKEREKQKEKEKQKQKEKETKQNETKPSTQKGAKETSRAQESDEESEELNSEDKDDGTVVRLRGLPWEVTKEDIIKFFAGLSIAGKDGICIALNFEARPTGDGFVRFVNAEQAKAALSRHMNYMGRRYICVERSTVLGFNSCSLFAKTISDRKRQGLQGKAGEVSVSTRRASEMNTEREFEQTGLDDEFLSAKGSRGRARGRGKSRSDAGNDIAATRSVELHGLQEMGFEEEEAIEALRKGLNLELTIEWLLEQRGEKERNSYNETSATHETVPERSPRQREESVHREESRRWETEKVWEPRREAHQQKEMEYDEQAGEEEMEDGNANDYEDEEFRDYEREEETDGYLPERDDQGREMEWDEGDARDWYSHQNDRLSRPYDNRPRPMPPAVGLPGRGMIPPIRPRIPGGPGILLPGGIVGPMGPVSPLMDLAREKQLSSSLWIGNVSQKVREEELRALFVPFGEIVSLKILRRSQCAFVNYSSPSAATAAKRHIQGKLLRDMRLEINFSKPPKAQRREERIPTPLMGQRLPPRPMYPGVVPGVRREDEGEERLDGVPIGPTQRVGGLSRLPNQSNDKREDLGDQPFHSKSSVPDAIHRESRESAEGKQPPRPIERPSTLSPAMRSISPPQRGQQPGKAVGPSPMGQGYSHFPSAHDQKTEERLGLHPLHSLNKQAQAEEEEIDEPLMAERVFNRLQENEHNEEEEEILDVDITQKGELDDNDLEEEEAGHPAIRGYSWMDGEGYGQDDPLAEIGQLGPFAGTYGGDEGEMFDSYPGSKNIPPSMEHNMGGHQGGMREDNMGMGYGAYLPRFGGHMYSQYDGAFGQEQEEGEPQQHNMQGQDQGLGQHGQGGTMLPSSYGLFGWQPKAFGGSAIGGHLSMNIWGSESTWGSYPVGGPSMFPPQGQPQQQQQYYEP